MDAARSGGDLAVRTAFSGRYDLLQVMRGLEPVPGQNSPVDFRLAALCDKAHTDIWHADRVLAFSTDECPPIVVNGEDIGGNHGWPCCVRIVAPSHGLCENDVGSLWRDESGLSFTLIRVENGGTLLLLSDNIGSDSSFRFADRVAGCLTPIDGGLKTIVPARQEGRVQLTPAIRHIRRAVLYLKDGRAAELASEVKGCDSLKIKETYDVMDPAAVAKALRNARRVGGSPLPLENAGEPLARLDLTYRFENDGAVICEFDIAALGQTRIDCYLGIMHQLRCDAFCGGLFRYIPGLKPIKQDGNVWDFSKPYRTRSDTMPERLPLTRDTWLDPNAPPDRQVDFLCEENGRFAVGFASGFLPVFDGAPSYRSKHITEAGTLVKSCKSYPTFLGGEINAQSVREGKKDALGFSHIKGAAYKKYILTTYGDALVYTIPYRNGEYAYMDCFVGEPRSLGLSLKRGQTARTLFSNLPLVIGDGRVEARGGRGYACLRIDNTE